MTTDSISHRPLLSDVDADIQTPPSGGKMPGTRFRFCSYLFLCILIINLCLMVYWRYDVKQTLGTISYHTAPRPQNQTYNSESKKTVRTKWISKMKKDKNAKGLIEHIKGLVGIQDDKYRDLLCLSPDDQTNLQELYKWFGHDSITLPDIPRKGFRSGAPDGFTAATTYNERKIMLKLMRVFRDTLWAHNYTFLLYGGTSLGSYRHHGFVAWDDDIDVWIPHVHRDDIAKILSEVKPDEYKVWTTWGTFQWKFYFANAPKIHTAWKWPYLDIFFYVENQTHVWDVSKCCGYYHIGDVFPPRQIPFSGITFPGPRNLPKFLFDYYGNINEHCKTTDFNHRKEYSKSSPSQTIPCKQLHPYYPFVFRTERDDYVEESLRVAGEELYSIHLPKYCSG